MAQPQYQDIPQNTYDTVRAPITSLLQKRAFKPALEILIKIHEAFPADPGMLDDMATCYWGIGNHRPAIELLRHITTLDPQNPAAWGKLGAMSLSAGDTDNAEIAFTQVLKLTPKSVPALAALNRIRIFDRKSHRAKTLRKLAETRNLPAADRATAFNALARIEEAAGNTKIAFRFFAKSKMHAGGSFEAAPFDQHVNDQIRLFKPSGSALECSEHGPRFVFVVGLPRSGSTLVENILCRHPQVGTVGESPALQAVLTTCRKTIARDTGRNGGWDWFGRLSEDQISTYRAQYIQLSLQGLGETPAPVIVDKLPLNTFALGFAQTIMPNAKFVFMSRHPLDVGLSCFSTNFHTAHTFTKRLDTIGAMTRTVYRSLEDYEAKLGPALRRQSYSALVTAPEPRIRALLEHVGLPWDEGCLTPKQGTGIVRTASLMQVRAPISTKAIGKWERYKAELEPLIDALGGWDWIDNWQSADTACAGIGA